MSYPPMIEAFLRQWASSAQRTSALESMLHGPAGPVLRAELGRCIVEQFVPAEALVPQAYANWRAPVRDAMLFVPATLSAARLAPKLVEQLELPSETPPETRLLRLVAKVPGLQKLGQVLARNRHLSPSLRAALSQLENSIRDADAQQIGTIICDELGRRLEKFSVEIEPAILSEASVSAVVRFTWRNPRSGEREGGVFKVMKPHIPACFAEDMELLHKLASYFGGRHREYGIAKDALIDTFNKVRRLLQHEIDFRGEQKTLVDAAALYPRGLAKVRVPQVIRPLCTDMVTAISEERGVKVTAVATKAGWRRGKVADHLVEALIALPLFAGQESVLFHADPHAGNLFYDERTGELVILDWALTERLGRGQRRQLALLVLMVILRDRVGARKSIEALCQSPVRPNSRQAQLIRATVNDFFDDLPLATMPGAVEAMKLLQQVAAQGIRFPAPLIMFSKVLFTLDGILDEIGGTRVPMALTLAQHLLRRYLTPGAKPGLPLTFRDWLTVDCSALLCGGRLWVKLEQMVLDSLLPRGATGAAVA